MDKVPTISVEKLQIKPSKFSFDKTIYEVARVERNIFVPKVTISKRYKFLLRGYFDKTMLSQFVSLIQLATRALEVEVTPKNEIRMEPERPFTNLIEVFDLMASLSGSVWLLDKHFDEKGFMFLRKLNPMHVNDVRVLMGKAHLSKDFKELCKSFRDEMANQGVTVEFRVVGDADAREIHDRYLISHNLAYNTPPWNIVHRKLGDIVRLRDSLSKRKYFEKYWSRAAKLF